MDQQLLQRTRYLLQARFRRIRTAEIGNFERVCQQVFDWLEHHPILGSVLQHLENIPGDHHHEIKLLLDTERMNGSRYFHLTVKKGPKQEHEPEFKGYTPTTLEEHASACLQILRAVISRPSLEFYCLLAVYLTQEDYDELGRHKNMKDAFQIIQDKAAQDLYEYLDERLDGINAVNGILQKYKQSTEWFQQEHLRQIERGYEGKSGERALALHLQQYIFNQGVEFTIEPSSVSGEVDLLLRDPAGLYTIIDAKYIKPTSSRSDVIRKIADGFNQVARYCNDYNQPEGFLAIFVNDDITLLVELEQNDGFRFFRVGGCIIYYIEINMAERPSASKSGKSKQINVSAAELIGQIEDFQQ